MVISCHSIGTIIVTNSVVFAKFHIAVSLLMCAHVSIRKPVLAFDKPVIV